MIHRSEISIDDQSMLVRDLDDYHDLVRTAVARNEEGQDHLGNSSLDSREDWSGTRSLEHAIDLARFGWPEGVARVEWVLEHVSVDRILARSAFDLQPSFEVAGDEPDIGRFLGGDPENMVEFNPNLNTHGSVLDIVVNVSQHAGVSAQRIENRGAAIMASVEALRRSGYSVGVMAVERVAARRFNSEQIEYRIPLLRPGEPISLDTLSFAMLNPSFLRRFIFALNETEDTSIREKFGFESMGGYGMPVTIADFNSERPSHVIDKDDGLFDTPGEVEEFAQTVTKDVLVKLGATEE